MECVNVKALESYEGVYFQDGGVYCTPTEEGEVLDTGEALDAQYETSWTAGGSPLEVSAYFGRETRRVNDPTDNRFAGIHLGLFNDAEWKEFFGLQVGVGNNVCGTSSGCQLGIYNSTEESRLFQAGINNVSRGISTGWRVGAVNISKGNMNGVDGALLWNDSDGTRNDGVQLALFANDADGGISGLQASLFVNNADGDVKGWQGSLITNICDGSLTGAQTTLGVNITDRNVDGAQASLIWNFAGGRGEINRQDCDSSRGCHDREKDLATRYYMKGWQGALFGNSAFGPFGGAQTSIFYNMVNGLTNDGFQFGAINYLAGSESKNLPLLRYFSKRLRNRQK